MTDTALVVPSYERTALLDYVLGLAVEHLKPSEVVVIHNGPARLYGAACGIKSVNFPGATVSQSFNLGATISSAKNLLFMHNDLILWSGPEDPRFDVTGYVVVNQDGELINEFAIDSVGVGRPYAVNLSVPKEGRECVAVGTVLMSMRRDLYDSLGGFDESMGYDHFDVDFCLRAKRAGATIGVQLAPNALHIGGARHPSHAAAVRQQLDGYVYTLKRINEHGPTRS